MVGTHQRASDSNVIEIMDGKKRTTVTSDPLMTGFFAFRDRVLFLRSDVNAGLWAAPFSGDRVDFEHATLLQANAEA